MAANNFSAQGGPASGWQFLNFKNKRGFTRAPHSSGIKSGAGFTLIEMMVSAVIFLIIIGIASGLFISSLKAQRQALASREILDSLSYNLEYISRALRMAQKDLVGTCIPNKVNYQETPRGQGGIKFLNYDGSECQEFFLDTDGILKEDKTSYAQSLPLTPEGITINSCKFELSGQSQDDYLQPRVTISLDVQCKKQAGVRMKIQTTVSQRNLDVIY